MQNKRIEKDANSLMSKYFYSGAKRTITYMVIDDIHDRGSFVRTCGVIKSIAASVGSLLVLNHGYPYKRQKSYHIGERDYIMLDDSDANFGILMIQGKGKKQQRNSSGANV